MLFGADPRSLHIPATLVVSETEQQIAPVASESSPSNCSQQLTQMTTQDILELSSGKAIDNADTYACLGLMVRFTELEFRLDSNSRKAKVGKMVSNATLLTKKTRELSIPPREREHPRDLGPGDQLSSERNGGR